MPTPVIRDLFVTASPPLERLPPDGVDRRPARRWALGSERRNTRGSGTSPERFRKENPGIPIRVLLIDAPISHYGHIERPKQLAAVLLGAVKWVVAESSPARRP